MRFLFFLFPHESDFGSLKTTGVYSIAKLLNLYRLVKSILKYDY